MIFDYFKLAFKNLKHRGLRSWLTILGVLIGIAAVVSLISMGQGLQSAITGQFSSLDVDKLTIQNAGTGFGPPGSTSVEKLNQHDVDLLKSVRGVDLVLPRLIRVVKAEYNNQLSFSYIASNPEEEELIDLIVDSLNVELESGRFLTSSDKGKIVLGNDFSNDDMFGKPIRVGSSIKIQDKNFEVIGILKKASTFQVNSVIIMPEEDLVDILGIEKGEQDIIVVQVEDPDEIEQVAKSIEDKLRKDRNLKIGQEDFSVETPSQSLEAVSTILNIINLIVAGIAAISLLIGSIGITNTMYTSVLERTKEIGVMKAIGAQNKDILFVFMIESGLLGLVGGIVGALAGLGLAFTASIGANSALGTDLFQVSPSIPLLFGAIAFSFIVGILAGIVPALQASNMNPVEALRR